jgi:hypothetical protein
MCALAEWQFGVDLNPLSGETPMSSFGSCAAYGHRARMLHHMLHYIRTVLDGIYRRIIEF